MSWPFRFNRRFIQAPATYNGIFPNVSCTILAVTSAFTSSGTTALTGTTTIGDASTDTCTMTGRFLPREVTDAGPMTATPGTKREIVYNTSNDTLYVCTATHATAATWSALN